MCSACGWDQEYEIPEEPEGMDDVEAFDLNGDLIESEGEDGN